MYFHDNNKIKTSKTHENHRLLKQSQTFSITIKISNASTNTCEHQSTKNKKLIKNDNRGTQHEIKQIHNPDAKSATKSITDNIFTTADRCLRAYMGGEHGREKGIYGDSHLALLF